MNKEKRQFPTIVCYRLTRKCNLHCSFCLAGYNFTELSTQEIMNSIKIMSSNGMQCIRISGGEPTLREDLIDIIRYCLQQQIQVKLSSNLYDISRFFDDFIKLPISITTSIHGSEAYHNSVVGADAYKKTCDNIRILLRNNIDVNVHSVLTPANYKDTESLIKDMIKLGIKKITFQSLIPRERAKDSLDDNQKAQLVKQLDLISFYSKKYDQKIRVKTLNLYQKFFYVYETDGVLYLQKETEERDEIIWRNI